MAPSTPAQHGSRRAIGAAPAVPAQVGGGGRIAPGIPELCEHLMSHDDKFWEPVRARVWGRRRRR